MEVVMLQFVKRILPARVKSAIRSVVNGATAPVPKSIEPVAAASRVEQEPAVAIRPGHDLPVELATMEEWEPLPVLRRSDSSVPSSLISAEEMGRHLDYLQRMHEANEIRNTTSHTTTRCRYELLTYLLDTPGTAPVIEVGTMWGGLTCMFAYVASVTGRKFYAVDIEPIRMNVTKDTCAYFGLANHITFFTGTLKQFVDSGGITERPDLVFIDSAHSYNVTTEELEALHGQPHLPRAIALHDFNYRQGAQADLFGDNLTETNPIAINVAVHDFYQKRGTRPLFKRAGSLTSEGTVATKSTRGAIMGDYVEDHGSEAMFIFHP